MPNSTDIHFLIKSHFLMKSTDSLSNPPTIIFIRFTCSGCKERLNQTYQTTNIMNIQNIHFSHVITQMKTKTVVLPYVRFTKGNKNTIDSVPTSHSSTQLRKKRKNHLSHLTWFPISYSPSLNGNLPLISTIALLNYFQFDLLQPTLCSISFQTFVLYPKNLTLTHSHSIISIFVFDFHSITSTQLL